MAIKSRHQYISELILGEQEEWKIVSYGDEDSREARARMRAELEKQLAGVGRWDGMSRQTSMLITKLRDPQDVVADFFGHFRMDSDKENSLWRKISRVRALERGD